MANAIENIEKSKSLFMASQLRVLNSSTRGSKELEVNSVSSKIFIW